MDVILPMLMTSSVSVTDVGYALWPHLSVMFLQVSFLNHYISAPTLKPISIVKLHANKVHSGTYLQPQNQPVSQYFVLTASLKTRLIDRPC